MKSTATKEQFIRLRAEGLSYDRISKQLHISKSTCSTWEHELSEQITAMKQERLSNLYEEYGMLKEQRIKVLGNMLRKIDASLADADFSMMTPAQLLDFKLKYQKALQNEYVPTNHVPKDKVNMKYIQERLLDLAERARNNELGAESTQELQALKLVISSYSNKKEEDPIDLADSLASFGIDY